MSEHYVIKPFTAYQTPTWHLKHVDSLIFLQHLQQIIAKTKKENIHHHHHQIKMVLISVNPISKVHAPFFLCSLFLSLLSLSFLTASPLQYSFFPIIDALFRILYCCSSITLFELNQNLTKSLMKSSSRGSRFFSKEGGISGHRHGHRVNDSDGDSSLLSMMGSSSQDYSFFDSAAFSVDVPSSPLSNSPWSSQINFEFHEENDRINNNNDQDFSPNLLLGSLVREEGHIYSLAASHDLLYTGSDSKNIRVWKNQKEFSGFKSNSGLVKAIVIANDRIFTGHQDGKIRVWKISSKNASIYKRIGTLPKFKDFVKSSMRPSNYVEIRRNRNTVWLKHFDAISCLSLSEDKSLLYSASWDKTFKVWRISDSKCLESVTAHDDAVNSIVAGFDGLVFTGSADGTVKVWRRETQGKGTKHFFSQALLKQECAVTALAVNPEATIIYSGSSDGFINLWERQNHLSHGGVLRGHKLAVLCLITASSLVISGSADMGICVWRRLGGDHIWLSFLTGHTGPVKCLAAEKDHECSSGERWILYSGSLDKSMKIWQVSENAPPMAWNGCESSMPAFLPSIRSSRGSRSMSDALQDQPPIFDEV